MKGIGVLEVEGDGDGSCPSGKEISRALPELACSRNDSGAGANGELGWQKLGALALEARKLGASRSNVTNARVARGQQPAPRSP